MHDPVIRPTPKRRFLTRGRIGRTIGAILIGLVVGGGFTAVITHFGKDELRHPLVGTLVCGGDLTVDIKSAGRGNRVACVDAAGVEVGQASQFAGLKLMAPAWIVFAGIGLYLLSLRARRSAP